MIRGQRCAWCRRCTTASVLRRGQLYCCFCDVYTHRPGGPLSRRWTLGDQDQEEDPASRRFAGLEVD